MKSVRSLATFILLCSTAAGAPPLAIGAPAVPPLVRSDGSYPTVPLEKDVVVLKVVQNSPVNLQKAPTVAEGLATNLERMAHWINEACTKGKKPDFILFNEFPLTGYSAGTRAEKLKFTIQVLALKPTASASAPWRDRGRDPDRAVPRGAHDPALSARGRQSGARPVCAGSPGQRPRPARGRVAADE